MAKYQMFEPRILNGQGKRTVTLLTEDGCVYPIIAHDAKSDRARHISAPAGSRIRWGERPMHRSTITLAKPPWVPDYTSTHKQYFGGCQTLHPEPRLPPARSMHHSQLKSGQYHSIGPYPGHLEPTKTEDRIIWTTNYHDEYFSKPVIPARHLHLTSFIRSIDQAEGAKIKEVVKPESQPMNYFTQYKRVHDKLGVILGPGVAREYPIREQYSVITGEELGPAWKPENHRVSGNRVLHGIRSSFPSGTIQ